MHKGIEAAKDGHPLAGAAIGALGAGYAATKGYSAYKSHEALTKKKK
jgi:hypothetical protein